MAENKGHCYGFKLLCPLFSLASAVLRSANYMQLSARVFYNGITGQRQSLVLVQVLGIRDSADLTYVIVFLILIRPRTSGIISTYSMVIWDTTSNVV